MTPEEFADLMADSQYHDLNSANWAARAVGVLTSLVMSADNMSKDDMLDYITKLLALAPDETLVTATQMAQAIAAQRAFPYNINPS